MISLLIMYRIDMIERKEYEDGHLETVLCDETIELIAVELDNMGLSLPLSIEDDETICDHFQSLDADIGGVEMIGIYPTREYDEQTGRAVDEFMDVGDRNYTEINDRVKHVLDLIDKGTYEPRVKARWILPDISKVKKQKRKEMMAEIIRFLSVDIPAVGYLDAAGQPITPDEYMKDWEC